MRDFILDKVGPSGLACVFEDDGETGYLYLYDPNGRGVLEDLQIYNRAGELKVNEKDVQVVWSTDGSKCGVDMEWYARNHSHQAEGKGLREVGITR